MFQNAGKWFRRVEEGAELFMRTSHEKERRKAAERRAKAAAAPSAVGISKRPGGGGRGGATWYTLDEVAELIPSDIVNSKNINANTDWTLKAKNFKYYLKVLEMKSRKDIAPLSFIQEQASRAVLHRRKLKILAEWRESLYKKALSENKVKVHTN